MLGLDRQAMSEQLFAGRQPVADTKVSALDWVYTADVTRYATTRRRPRRCWTRPAGPRSGTASATMPQGQPLQLELMTTAGNRTRELVEQVLQSQWRRIGIDIRIKNEPARVFFGETLDERRFTGLAMFAWISAPENVPRTILHSEEIPTAANDWAGQNYAGYVNPEVDQLIDAHRDRARPRQAQGDVAPSCSRSMPTSCRRCRCISAPTRTSGRNGWTASGRPGTCTPSTLWVEQWGAGTG